MQFASQVTSVGGNFASFRGLDAVREYVTKLAGASKSTRIVMYEYALESGLFPSGLDFGGLEIAKKTKLSREQFFEALKTADIGISPVDLAVAEAGTLIIVTSDESERLVTALPRIHVAVLPRSRLVASFRDAPPTISQALSRTGGVAVSLISATSRTSDIAHQLVMGVHGPKALHVCMVDQELS